MSDQRIRKEGEWQECNDQADADIRRGTTVGRHSLSDERGHGCSECEPDENGGTATEGDDCHRGQEQQDDGEIREAQVAQVRFTGQEEEERFSPEFQHGGPC